MLFFWEEQVNFGLFGREQVNFGLFGGDFKRREGGAFTKTTFLRWH